MGFGPAHPHAVFRTIPVVPRGLTPLSDPFAVAVDFVEDLLGNQLAADNTYTVREDSYTDKNTGVSHVYIRQIINGIEVADGDLNVNVKDGIVISYGDSVSAAYSALAFSLFT
jgi:extracellular elastinolytic metalloproteinase